MGGLDMRRKSYSEEQIISIVRENEAGLSVEEVVRKHGIAHSTFHRWKSKFAGMDVSEAKRLRELQAENAKLKKLLAETLLDKVALEDVVSKKVVTPSAKRAALGYLPQAYAMSQRHACALVRLSRKAASYQPAPRTDAPLVARLKALGEQYPRYGYLMLHALMKSEGLVVNRKKTYRLYCELGMQVRTKKRKKLVRPRLPMAVPSQSNERWSLDFVSDQLANGRRIRILNIVDDFSRTCVGQLVDTSISGARLARYLDELKTERGLPTTIVLDNGPELTSKAMFLWSQRCHVKLQFIQPGKPTQNAFVESFNGKFRDHSLNQH
jgi:putative transposase